jgi:hypothetical protein
MLSSTAFHKDLQPPLPTFPLAHAPPPACLPRSVAPEVGSAYDSAVRLNKVMWLEITTNMPSVPRVPPGTYEGRCRLKVQPGFKCQELTITTSPEGGCGAPASRTYTKAELEALAATGGWVEISSGPATVTREGRVEIKVHSTRTGDWKQGIVFDHVKLVYPGECAGQSCRQSSRAGILLVQ